MIHSSTPKMAKEYFILDLLEHILSDPKMNQREKKKKLLKFKDAYPIIWRRRLPDSDSLPEYLKDSGSSGSKERFPSLTRLKNVLRIWTVKVFCSSAMPTSIYAIQVGMNFTILFKINANILNRCQFIKNTSLCGLHSLRSLLINLVQKYKFVILLLNSFY